MFCCRLLRFTKPFLWLGRGIWNLCWAGILPVILWHFGYWLDTVFKLENDNTIGLSHITTNEWNKLFFFLWGTCPTLCIKCLKQHGMGLSTCCAQEPSKNYLEVFPAGFLTFFNFFSFLGVVFGLDGFDLPPSRVPLSFRDFIRDASFSKSLKPACSAAPLSIGNHGKPNIHQNQILTYCKMEN